MSYDVAIIGAGPGGYVAAIRCAQLGMKVALIEKEKTLGGTCLNVGCIPSKALLDSSEHYYNAVEKFAEHGIKIGVPKVDMPQMIKRKNEVVNITIKGIDFLMKKNNVDVIKGHSFFKSTNTLQVGDREVKAKNIIIATGSEPLCPPDFNYDGNRIITSTEALNISKIPKKMVVIGAGVIGLELGSVYARLGTEVEVVEFQDTILGEMDGDISKEMRRSLKKLGLKFYLKHKVTAVKSTKTKVNVEIEKRDGGDPFSLEADYCLIAIGRKAYTEGLKLDKAGVQSDDKGRVDTNQNFQTNVPNIYAIGDVVKGVMLAHKAEEEGIYVAEYLAGQKPHINHHLIPGVVYTWPEVSTVGATEDQLKEAGTPYNVGKFPMKALGRSRASMDTEGLIKVLAHKETDEILGVHMVGARAADLIMEAVALMEFRGSAEDMARICHPHPTYSEAVKEAALDATGGRAIHK
ncbi:MAG: dihydrolipoyl dehydrogenase [Saprospiraceae bacterium]